MGVRLHSTIRTQMFYSHMFNSCDVIINTFYFPVYLLSASVVGGNVSHLSYFHNSQAYTMS